MKLRPLILAVATLVVGAIAPTLAYAQDHHPSGRPAHPAPAAHPARAHGGHATSSQSPAPSPEPASTAPSTASQESGSPSPQPETSSATPVETSASPAPSTEAASTTPAASEPPAPQPVAAPAPLAPLVLPRHSRPEAIVATVLALGGIITGAVFGVITLGDQSRFNSNPSFDNADTAARDGMFADIAFGVGLASAVVAVVLWVIPHADGPNTAAASRPHRSTAVHVAPNGLALSF